MLHIIWNCCRNNVYSSCLPFLDGVPKVLIPDKLRSAVKKAERYEPVINGSYQALTEYYGTVIIPARLHANLKINQK